MPITGAFFYVTFRVLSKGASPTVLGSLPRAPIERDAPFSESSFNYLSEFTVNGPPMILNRAHVEKGAHLQSLLKSPADEPSAKFPSGTPKET
jgi:hypothetical protein